MLKENFYNYLDDILKDKSFTEKKQTLKEITNLLHDYSDALEKSYTTCTFCKKQIPSSTLIYHENTEVRKNVFIDTSADPNDLDAVFGDVEYLVTYIECPECHKIKEHSKKSVKILKTYLGELK